MTSKIVLRRKLYESTARSKHLDPGVPETLGMWKTGPRNLVLAIADMKSQKAHDLRCFGNIGMGERWLEIDGQRIDAMDVSFVWNEIGLASERVELAKIFLRNRTTRPSQATIESWFDA